MKDSTQKSGNPISEIAANKTARSSIHERDTRDADLQAGIYEGKDTYDLEAGVIATISAYNSPDGMAEAIGFGLQSSHFSDPTLRKLYAALETDHTKQGDCDPFACALLLKQDDAICQKQLETVNAILCQPVTSNGLRTHANKLRNISIANRFAALRTHAGQCDKDGDYDLADEYRAEADALKSESTTQTFPDSSHLWEGQIDFAKPTVGRFADRALLYEATVNCIYGEPGKGKSWLALFIAAELIQAGYDVLFIDPESSEKRIICRLKGLGVKRDKGAKYFHYCSNIEPKKIKELQRWSEKREKLFVVYDGLANAIAAGGHEENSNAALTILQEQAKPFADGGACVLVVDHTGKNPKKGERGHSSKRGFYKGAIYSVTPHREFSPKSEGFLRLIMEKDNEGGTGLTVGQSAADFHHVIDERGRGSFELRDPNPENEIKPGAKAKMTDAEIIKALPVGEERAMNLASINPALKRATFTERCREIEGVHVDRRKGGSGQPQNYFWREPDAGRAKDDD